MVGKTNPLEIGGLMAVLGIKQSGSRVFVKVPDKEDMVIVRVMSRNTKLKTKIKDGKPHVFMKIHYEAEIDESYSEKVNIQDDQTIKGIQKEFCKAVEESLTILVKKIQEDDSDIFGFGEYFRAKHSSYWNNQVGTKEKWHSVYKDLTFESSCSVDIRRVGMKAK